MSKSRKKLFKRIFWTISVLFVLIVVSGITLAYIYEDEVKQFAISKINERTKSKIKVEKIELSFLKRFPMAALQFHNVEVMEVVKAGEPGILLKADDLYLKFNIIDLIQNKLVIKDVEIEKAILNLVVFEDGSDNFHVFKSTEKKESNMLLELLQVSLNNSSVRYHNYASKQDLELDIDNVSMSGNFSKEKFEINLGGTTKIKKYSSEGYKMFENKELELDIDVAINPKTKQFIINKGDLRFNRIPLSIDGNITIPEQGVLLDLSLKAPSISLVQLLNSIPAKYKSRISDYEIQGVLGLTASIKGLIVSRSTPNIKVNILLNDAEIRNVNFDTKLENISVQASYSNGKKHSLSSSTIQIKNISFNLGESSFQAQMKLSNLVNSRMQLELNSQLDLGELLQFTGQIYGIQKLDGQAELNLKVAGKLSGIVGDQKLDLSNLQYKAQLKMEGSNFKHQSSGVYYQNIVGIINIDANSIVIEPTWLDINGNRQQLSGSINNYRAWTNDSEHNKLKIRANTKISHLSFKDIDQILSNGESGDGAYPNDIDMVLSFAADTFVWQNMLARNASGVFSLRNQILSFQNTQFDAFGGTIKANTSINGSLNTIYPLVCEGTLNNIDINRLFKDFHNFNQQVITDKNVKGLLTSTVKLNIDFDNDWNVISKSMILKADVVINDGELIDIKELNALSKYTRIDDFSLIKFSTLKNTIQIKDRKLLIPDMLVKSNKMDIDLAGSHDFDNKYDYHIGVLLSDVLFKKAKEKSENEFGEVQSDGYGRTKLFFHVYGEGEDMHVKYDHVSLAKKIKKDMKEEGDDLKTTLNKEFGWYKKSQEAIQKDSIKTAKEQKKEKEKEELKKQEEGEFIFEWDEGEEEEQEPPLAA